MLNEILQWIVILIAIFVVVIPKVVQVVRDFRQEEDR